MSVVTNKDFDKAMYKELVDAIQYDAYYAATPDTTQLRYSGPIPVFMWGNNSAYEKMKNIMDINELKQGTDYRVTDMIFVKSRREFYLFENRPEKEPSDSFWQQKELCFSNCSVVRNFIHGRKRKPEAAPMVGRVYTVSLSALRFLDLYFDNCRSSFRDKISLVDVKGDKDIKAYAYIHNPTFFLSKGGETGSEWVQKEGHTLTPFPITLNGNKDKYYARSY